MQKGSLMIKLLTIILASTALLSAYEPEELTLSVTEPSDIERTDAAVAASRGYKTYMEIPTTDITVHNHTTAVACENVVKLFMTFKYPLSGRKLDELKKVADIVAKLHEETLRYKKSIIEPMLFFAGLGIETAREWVTEDEKARDALCTMLVDFKHGSNLNTDLMLAVFKSWLELAPQMVNDAKILRAIVNSSDLKLISYLVNRPDAKVLFIPSGITRRVVLTPDVSTLDIITERPPLAGAFPLTDPEKACILARAFGAATLTNARPLLGPGTISVEAVVAMLKESLNNSNDFLTALNQLVIFLDELSPETLDLSNDQGDTILMKLIEYQDRYANPELAELSSLLLNAFIEIANLNTANRRGETALIKAAKKGNVEIMQKLLGCVEFLS
jgi:Ankyrin repeats (many copies)